MKIHKQQKKFLYKYRQCCFSNDTECIIDMLKSGFDPNGLGKYAGEPLFWAIQNGKVDIVKILFDYGVDLLVLNPKAPVRSPVLVAIFYKQEECLDLLIKNGATLNENDRFGRDIFDYNLLWRDKYTEDEYIRVVTKILAPGQKIHIDPAGLHGIYRGKYFKVIEFLSENNESNKKIFDMFREQDRQ